MTCSGLLIDNKKKSCILAPSLGRLILSAFLQLGLFWADSLLLKLGHHINFTLGHGSITKTYQQSCFFSVWTTLRDSSAMNLSRLWSYHISPLCTELMSALISFLISCLLFSRSRHVGFSHPRHTVYVGFSHPRHTSRWIYSRVL